MTKSEAARLNGKRGGRPRKADSTREPVTPKPTETQPLKTHETQAAAAGAQTHPLLARCTRHEQAFILELLADPKLNQRAAYYKAGFKAKNDVTADTQASYVLRKPQVRAAYDALQAERAARFEVRHDRVLQELARIAFADVRELFDDQNNLKSIHALSDDAAAALVSIDVRRGKTTVTTAENGSREEIEDSVIKVKAADKIGALALLARHLGMLHDKVDHKHTFTLEEALEASRHDAAA